MKTLPLVMAVALLCQACRLPGHSTEDPAPGAPVLGYLVLRDHVITMRTSGEHGQYTVTAKGGEVLAADLTEAELASRFPAIHELVQRSLAGETDLHAIGYVGD